MCGRYTYKLDWRQIVELYRLTLPDAAAAAGLGDPNGGRPTPAQKPVSRGGLW